MLVSLVQPCDQFLRKGEQLSFAATSGPEPVLAISEDMMFIQVIEDIAGDYMLLDLATKAGEGDWLVIGRLVLLSFFKDCRDICGPPVPWYNCSIETPLENCGQYRCDLISHILQDSNRK